MFMIYLSMLETAAEKSTFEEIYENVRRKCYAVALKITRNQTMAEDALQDAFEVVIKNKTKVFDLTCEEYTPWIVVITKNKALDLLRAGNNRNTVPFNDEYSTATPNAPDVGKLIEDQEAYDHLRSCIAALPENYKAVMEMRYVLDLTNPEIAKILGITAQNVSMRINRGKTMLQEMLGKKETPYEN